MTKIPESITQFLAGKRIAVAGVSRGKGQAANAVFRKLKACEYEVFPVNPKANVVEGVTCYPDLEAIPIPSMASSLPRILRAPPLVRRRERVRRSGA